MSSSRTKSEWPWHVDPAGVVEQGTFTRVLQEPGRSRRLRPWRAVPTREETKRDGTAAEKSELFIVPTKWGNRPAGPCGGKGEPGCGTVGGKDGEDTKPHNCLNKTGTDSDAGEASARDGVHIAESSRGSRVATRGPSVHRQGRRRWCRRADGRRVREQAFGKSPDAARSCEVRYVPSAARTQGPHPEGRWEADATYRHSERGISTP